MPHERHPQQDHPKEARTAVDEFQALRRETRQHFEAVSRRLDRLLAAPRSPRRDRLPPR